MRFLYQGFTHKDGARSFIFQGISEQKVETIFSIRVNLLLFARNKMAIQDGPGFCLNLLTSACASTPDALEKLHQYQVLEADLLPILADREKRAMLKAGKGSSHRFVRKPSPGSQFRSPSRTVI
jgi:hypothetical protein